MEIHYNVPELMQIRHHCSHLDVCNITIAGPTAYMLFTYNEYDYLGRLTHRAGVHINSDLYKQSIYEQYSNDQVPHIKIHLDYILKHIRLLILADYDIPYRQPNFISDLRKLLGHGWL